MPAHQWDLDGTHVGSVRFPCGNNPEYGSYKGSTLTYWQGRGFSSVQHCTTAVSEGLMNRSTEVPQIGDMELSHPELGPGGEWFPRSCIPRQRIAIIIPFRDREEHLRALLTALHQMLQRQQLHYTIFVIEQVCVSLKLH